jgi:hypothetical protein
LTLVRILFSTNRIHTSFKNSLQTETNINICEVCFACLHWFVSTWWYYSMKALRCFQIKILQPPCFKCWKIIKKASHVRAAPTDVSIRTWPCSPCRNMFVRCASSVQPRASQYVQRLGCLAVMESGYHLFITFEFKYRNWYGHFLIRI